MSQTRNSTRFLAEFVLIVVSILAAFAVDEFREDRAGRQLKASALSNIRTELASNRDALDAVMPYHQEIAGSMGPFLADESNWQGKSGFGVGAAVAPRGILPPDLRRTAWETARATGALALFDYDLGQMIAQVYEGQETGVDATVDRMVNHIFTSEMFRADDTGAVLMLLGAMAGELFAQEQQLHNSLESLLEELQ